MANWVDRGTTKVVTTGPFIQASSNRTDEAFAMSLIATVFSTIDESSVKKYLLLLAALSLFALAPLMAPGYFYGAHDGRHSVFFTSMFDEAIRSGALWPQWAMHHNQLQQVRRHCFIPIPTFRPSSVAAQCE